MAAVDLPPYVKPERDRQGRVVYYYFRRHGRRWRLPGAPLSDEFMAAWHQHKAATDKKTETAGPVAYPPKSFGALALDYYASAEFRDLAPSSKSMYRRVIDPIVEKEGLKHVALIERRHVKRWRDARAETPGMANMVVSVARLLMTYAMDNEYRKDNPALRLKTFKLGEHRAWTEDELAAYERRWKPSTMQRRAYALARYTGQRCVDVAAMTRAHRQSGRIRVKQRKTGKELWLHEHKELRRELARGEQGHMSLLTQESGVSFTAEGLSDYFGGWIDLAGLPDDCVMHGLRKVAARDLAEAGCTDKEIEAVTGMSPKMVAHYTKSANQGRLAEAAILKLERNMKRAASGKRPRQPSGKLRLEH